MVNKTERFLHEWLTIADMDKPISPAFEQQAYTLGVDLRQAYYAIVIKHSQQITRPMHIQLSFRLDAEHIVFILHQFESPTLVTKYFSTPNQIGIGKAHFDISGTIKEALQALCFTTPNSINHQATYQMTQQFEALRNSGIAKEHLVTIINNLGSGQDELNLLNTFWVFTITNHSIAKTATILHVHRKTVEYRLKRLATITQHNPQDVIENIDLLAAYISWRTQKLTFLLAKLASISKHMLPRDTQVTEF
ncbi:PucR family transcriptional regulator [Periweissella fabalis]|uniref:PucR family transcriptional regulator n=1 Tax=Periweissella fabalis TaxID=1070421 RepID=A0A7X6N497_9LACO|nr:helix-turn-helix domain-containing protein [Periweissella fabalis]MCM0599326.1 helix-turn-helix domain-containing protein [Periweissella fabalis]NKZ23605.1 PucR family transcriptional regulator [Periweissella fabalis]